MQTCVVKAAWSVYEPRGREVAMLVLPHSTSQVISEAQDSVYSVMVVSNPAHGAGGLGDGGVGGEGGKGSGSYDMV